MADREAIVDKLRNIAKDPEAIKRLKEAQKRARETIDFIHKAGELPANWREQRFNI